jgi:hypothetical protein
LRKRAGCEEKASEKTRDAGAEWVCGIRGLLNGDHIAWFRLSSGLGLG